MSDGKQLDAIFGALSHRARRAILRQLLERNATVNELAAPLAMSLPAVSRHIRVLEEAGLISQGRDAQFRPCALNPAALKTVVSWTSAYRSIWETRFDAMRDVMGEIEDRDDGTS